MVRRNMERARASEPRVAEGAAHGPAAVIARRAADRLRAGHLWVYRSDVETLVPAVGAVEIAGGSLVSVLDGRGIPLGSGLYSAASQIAVRMVSGAAPVGRGEYLASLRERAGAALRLREDLVAEGDACRLIFSEADGLPGIVADRYNDLVILQLLTQGTAQEDVRRVLVEVVKERFPEATMWERPDPRIRELEELAAPSDKPLYSSGVAKTTTVFTINGVRFNYDAGAGQKTGAFLDQRLNYAAAARYAKGVALDVCTYQGGFALHLAQRCKRVTGVDASRAALEVADSNLTLNAGMVAEVDWIEADAFELLREYDATGQRFDTIVLDPPAFAKSKRAVEGALRGYKELNLRAMKMLREGGTLVTCSCSHHVSPEEFRGVVAAAASDAGKRVQVMEVRGAAPDHPDVLTLPETNYLKCLICRVG
ncbi:class I SAM-dependent rRNA methyltransferase [Edaphobacter bradus]|uniref:class I SAM-dependent rRNA methyltransferase n=1 Tax=Edaphobacter bradus TaxID=2259016 RepID=UPI0021E0BD28|nr:class I SAM-dependent rRNA methyltransferase [Edaphobacter bradus]